MRKDIDKQPLHSRDFVILKRVRNCVKTSEVLKTSEVWLEHPAAEK